MAAARGKRTLAIPALEDSAAFAKAIEGSDKMLVVVDVHQAWCGPCTVMEPLFRRIFLEQDRVEDRMKIFTVDESKLTDDQRKGFPTKGGTSKPLFVLYKSRVAVAKVQGANAPELEAAILENMPPLSSVE